MMKITVGIEKKKKGDIEKARGHNLRLHPTKSQLPKANWLTVDGMASVVEWDESKVEKAVSMMKRHDAVVAIEITLQIGDQTHWREMPTPENPFGAYKKGTRATMKTICEGAKVAIEKEFGAENVVSIVMHTDESSPHIHAIVIPVKDGKLQAKHWTGGRKKVGSMWERLHKTMNEFVPCTYKKAAEKELGDALGGQRHDPSKAAGAKNGPSIFGDLGLSLYEKLKQKVKPDELKKWMIDKISAMQKIIDELNEKLSDAFSRIKKLELHAAAQEKKIKEAEAMQARAQTNERKSEKLAADYKARIEQLENLLAEKEHMARLELESKRDGNGSMSLRELARRAGSNGPKMG